jgi:hypothetical protein
MQKKEESKMMLQKQAFIKKGTKFQDEYNVDTTNLLWRGEIGYIARCRHKVTQSMRAVRVIMKHKLPDLERFVREIQKLKEFVRFFS